MAEVQTLYSCQYHPDAAMIEDVTEDGVKILRCEECIADFGETARKAVTNEPNAATHENGGNDSGDAGSRDD